MHEKINVQTYMKQEQILQVKRNNIYGKNMRFNKDIMEWKKVEMKMKRIFSKKTQNVGKTIKENKMKKK